MALVSPRVFANPAFAADVRAALNVESPVLESVLRSFADTSGPISEQDFEAAFAKDGVAAGAAAAIFNFVSIFAQWHAGSGLDLADWREFLAKQIEDGAETLNSGEKSRFRALLPSLVQPLRGIALAVKVRELRDEGKLPCIRTRIVTDARPVFDGEPPVLVGFAVLQTLVLRYTGDDGYERELSVSVTAADLSNLAAQAARAQDKAMMLEAALRESGSQFVEGGT